VQAVACVAQDQQVSVRPRRCETIPDRHVAARVSRISGSAVG
jgi:hypothetical protein